MAVDILGLMEKWLEVTWSPAARAGHLTTALPFDLLTPERLKQVLWAIFDLFSSVFFKKGKTGLCQVLHAEDFSQILAILSCLGARHAILTQVLQLSLPCRLLPYSKAVLILCCSYIERTMCPWVLQLKQSPKKSQSYATSKSPPPMPLDWLQNIEQQFAKHTAALGLHTQEGVEFGVRTVPPC